MILPWLAGRHPAPIRSTPKSTLQFQYSASWTTDFFRDPLALLPRLLPSSSLPSSPSIPPSSLCRYYHHSLFLLPLSFYSLCECIFPSWISGSRDTDLRGRILYLSGWWLGSFQKSHFATLFHLPLQLQRGDYFTRFLSSGGMERRTLLPRCQRIQLY
jgi:hypothetical protein